VKATTKPKRQADIRSTMLPDGHLVLYSETSELACTLTPIGAIVWEYCDGNHTADEIIGELRAIQEISLSAALEEEVVQLLNDFNDSGLLEE